MRETELPLDIEAAIRALPIDVPGVGPVALSDMTPEHHERYHAALALDVSTRLGRIVSPPHASRAVAIGASPSAR
jgi:hypothetical protein